MFTSSNVLLAASIVASPVLHDSGSANVGFSVLTGRQAAPDKQEDAAGNVIGKGFSVADQLAYVRSLGEGWAGLGSAPIQERLIVEAQKAIGLAQSLSAVFRAPAVIPCADGSVQIEWHLADSRFEMYFETDGSTSAWWQDRQTNVELEAEDREASALLAKWTMRRGAWAPISIAA